tara:strand:- start:451 stop:924 length:474 start_codon:yes stop_codon:yes gene_type:complete
VPNVIEQSKQQSRERFVDRKSKIYLIQGEDMNQGTNFELVGDFMESMDQDVLMSPEFPDEHTQRLRINLIEEELDELQLAVDNEDMVEIADALTDLLYVVYGAGHAFGIDLDECFAEVHRSNLSKLGTDFKPIKREDGKVLKPDTYSPPDLKTVLAI